MLSVNQEIPEELVQTDSALLCPLLAGQMSVSHTAPLLGVLFVITFLSAKIHSVLLGAPHPKSYWTFCITGSSPPQVLLDILNYWEIHWAFSILLQLYYVSH